MKEEIPEAFGNTSIYQTEGDLAPAPSGLNPSSRYQDGRENVYFVIRENPKKQLIVSQLASLEIPVANVFQGTTKQGTMYFSTDVKKHPEYVEKDSDISKVNKMFLVLIFDDHDHEIGGNHTGSIFYDFGQAYIGESTPEIDNYLKRDCEDFAKQYPDDVTKLKNKIISFKGKIEGDSGLGFIKALIEKAQYDGLDAGEFQSRILKRCEIAIDFLE